MQYIEKIIDNPDLIRDSKGVIHNTNEDDFHKFIAQRELKQREIERIESLEKDVSEIKSGLNLILKLLQDDNR